MSDETGEQDAGDTTAGPGENAAEPIAEPATEPVPAAEPVAAAEPGQPAVPAAGAETVTTTDETGGSKRAGWLTPVLAGIAVLLLLGAGFGIGRWTDSGGDRDMRFLNGPGFRGPEGRNGRGFGGGNGQNGPSFGPRFGGPNGNSNGNNSNGPSGNGFGGGRGSFPGQNRPGRSSDGSNNGSNTNNGSTQPQQTLRVARRGARLAPACDAVSPAARHAPE